MIDIKVYIRDWKTKLVILQTPFWFQSWILLNSFNYVKKFWSRNIGFNWCWLRIHSFFLLCSNIHSLQFQQSRGLFIWEPGRDDKRDEKTTVIFSWSQDVSHPVSARRDPSCSRQDPGIAEIIFSIQKLHPGMKDVPP